MRAHQSSSVFAEKVRKRERGDEPGNGERVDESIPLQNAKLQVSSIELHDLPVERDVAGAGESADDADYAEDD